MLKTMCTYCHRDMVDVCDRFDEMGSEVECEELSLALYLAAKSTLDLNRLGALKH